MEGGEGGDRRRKRSRREEEGSRVHEEEDDVDHVDGQSEGPARGERGAAVAAAGAAPNAAATAPSGRRRRSSPSADRNDHDSRQNAFAYASALVSGPSNSSSTTRRFVGAGSASDPIARLRFLAGGSGGGAGPAVNPDPYSSAAALAAASGPNAIPAAAAAFPNPLNSYPQHRRQQQQEPLRATTAGAAAAAEQQQAVAAASNPSRHLAAAASASSYVPSSSSAGSSFLPFLGYSPAPWSGGGGGNALFPALGQQQQQQHHHHHQQQGIGSLHLGLGLGLGLGLPHVGWPIPPPSQATLLPTSTASLMAAGNAAGFVYPSTADALLAAALRRQWAEGPQPSLSGAQLPPSSAAAAERSSTSSSSGRVEEAIRASRGAEARAFSSTTATTTNVARAPAPATATAASTTADWAEARQQHDPDRSTPSSSSSSFPMSCPGDEAAMSKYQCMLRRQIEFFAATRSDLKAKAQGRNVKIRLGQVGIRCRHCSRAPPEARSRGSVYYPARLASLYQAVQNMSNNHYRDGTCKNAPPQVLAEIAELRRTRPKHSGGRGKRYFSQSAAALGIVDAENGSSGLELLSMAGGRGGGDGGGVASADAADADAEAGTAPPHLNREAVGAPARRSPSTPTSSPSDAPPPSPSSDGGAPGPPYEV